MAAASTLALQTWFSVANTMALAGWCGLVLLPRHPLLLRGLQFVVIGGLCLAYTTLVFVYFFGAGGGYGSLAQVQGLFIVPEVALAGWLHYLAFDLWVGLWIARRADAQGVSRWLQAPVLFVTFMFGPVGLLLYAAVAWRHVGLERLLGAVAVPTQTSNSGGCSHEHL